MWGAAYVPACSRARRCASGRVRACARPRMCVCVLCRCECVGVVVCGEWCCCLWEVVSGGWWVGGWVGVSGWVAVVVVAFMLLLHVVCVCVVSLCVCVSVRISLSPSLSVCVCVSLSLSLSLSVSLCVCVSVCACVFMSHVCALCCVFYACSSHVWEEFQQAIEFGMVASSLFATEDSHCRCLRCSLWFPPRCSSEDPFSFSWLVLLKARVGKSLIVQALH